MFVFRPFRSRRIPSACRPLVGWLCAALLGLGCATDPPPAVAPAMPESAPIPLGERGSEPLAFRRVVYRIPSNAVLGEVRVGRRVEDQMRWTVGRRQSTAFNVAVTDGLRALGYDVRDEADSLFDPKGQAKVRYEMAAILHDASVDFRYEIDRRDEKRGEGVGTADVEVEVRLFDALEKRTVYSRTFVGQGRDEGMKPNPLMIAVVEAILKTTEDPEFVALLAVQDDGVEIASLDDSERAIVVAACPVDPEQSETDPLPRTLGSVVEIQAGNVAGTGVLISPEGFILTAAHVVRDAPEVWVRIDGGAQLPARIRASDPESDLALLRIPGRNFTCAPIRRAGAQLELGSDVFTVNVAIGEDRRPTIARGVVSGYPVRDGRRLIQTDASLNPGSSGGPLLAPDGSVAGISILKMVGDAIEGLGLAVPADEAVKQLEIEWREP